LPRGDSLVNERAFVGRGEELAAIASCADSAAAGRARVVWIEGAAGSGKTALLRECLARLPAAFRLLRAEADELAGDLPFGVVAQLGSIGGAGAFAAGLDLLALLAAAQDAGPVAVVVVDLHWADAASRQALLPAARRLDEDNVVLLISSRPDPGAADGWERFCLDPGRCRRVMLGGLSVADIAELARRAGKALTRGHAKRLHQHTQGHALYAWTLLTELTRGQLAVPDGQLPAPRSLASATVAQLAALPAGARLLAAALSVVNQRSPLSVVGGIAGLAQPTPALEILLTTGLVTWLPDEIGTPVQFAHPLYRAAVYDDLSPTRRQALHRAAAQVLDAGAALRHRVAACDHADDRLADEAEAAACREAERGAVALAATYLLWAAPLSGARDHRERRLLAAMRLLLADGQTARAAGLADQAAACQAGPLRSLVLGTLAMDQGDAAAAERWLLAITAPDGDGPGHEGHQGFQADVLAAALGSLGSLYVHQGRGAAAVAMATRAISLEPADPLWERTAWSALALGEGMLHGAPAGLSTLARRLPETAEAVPAAKADLLITRGTLGFYAGRTMAAAADLRAVVRIAPQSRAVVQLPRAHLHLAQLLLSSGDWDEAMMHARVALSLTSDERQLWMDAQAHGVLATLAGYRGEWATADGQANAASAAAAALDTAEALFTARIGQAALARARDDPEGVVDSLKPLTGHGDVRGIPMLSSLGWWPTLIVAVIDCGTVEAAARQVDQLAQAAADRALDFRARMLGLRARVAQARGDLDQAASLFQQALELFGADDPLLDRALLQHAFGSLLRARGNRSAALDQLRSAHQLLAAMGAEPFRQRVAEDLARSGLRPAGQTTRAPLALTEREQDVVALVARGLTNREVAAELYISTKAVEYHLGNVFGKLGISSRRELRNRPAG
jgi:DNA-binding CsgD family transcriptional regulator